MANNRSPGGCCCNGGGGAPGYGCLCGGYGPQVTAVDGSGKPTATSPPSLAVSYGAVPGSGASCPATGPYYPQQPYTSFSNGFCAGTYTFGAPPSALASAAAAMGDPPPAYAFWGPASSGTYYTYDVYGNPYSYAITCYPSLSCGVGGSAYTLYLSYVPGLTDGSAAAPPYTSGSYVGFKTYFPPAEDNLCSGGALLLHDYYGCWTLSH